MLFGDRLLNTLKSLRDENAKNSFIDDYVNGAAIDFYKFNLTFIDDLNSVLKNNNENYEIKLQLDEFDFNFNCRILRNGNIRVSIGALIAIDCFSSLVATSFDESKFYKNQYGYDYLNERFPLFSDYSFLVKFKDFNIKANGEVTNVTPLYASIPRLPTDVESIQLWMLCSNLMLTYMILHEFGHLQLGHFDIREKYKDVNHTDLSKLSELEADVYTTIRIFQYCFRDEFHKHIEKLIRRETDLFYLLSSIILSTHGLVLGVNNSTLEKVTESKEFYPSENCRIVNINGS